MIAILSERGSLTAGKLGEPFKISQPSVSKHIRVLEKAGLITRSVAGRTHHFTLNSKPLDEADSWISRHKKLWSGSLDQLGTLVDELNQEGTNDA